MLTAHTLSAAYVAAQQAPTPDVQVGHRATYEPACVLTWAQQVQAMDWTMQLPGWPLFCDPFSVLVLV